MASVINRVQLQQRFDAINVLIRAHAGEIELAGVSPDGVVSVRYTGMCAGCDYRPVTTAGTVEPALLDVTGITGVKVLGAHISEEATARITATLDGTQAQERAVRLVRRIEAERHGEKQ